MTSFFIKKIFSVLKKLNQTNSEEMWGKVVVGWWFNQELAVQNAFITSRVSGSPKRKGPPFRVLWRNYRYNLGNLLAGTQGNKRYYLPKSKGIWVNSEDGVIDEFWFLYRSENRKWQERWNYHVRWNRV